MKISLISKDEIKNIMDTEVEISENEFPFGTDVLPDSEYTMFMLSKKVSKQSLFYGNHFRKFRKIKNMTRKELSEKLEKANIYVSPMQIEGLENGTGFLSKEQKNKIDIILSPFFGLEIDILKPIELKPIRLKHTSSVCSRVIKLRKMRELKGLFIEDVAEKMNIAPQIISDWEHDRAKRPISLESFRKLMRIYDKLPDVKIRKNVKFY